MELNSNQLRKKIISIISKRDTKKQVLQQKLQYQLPERTLRRLIETMVLEGYLIGTSAKRGYFIIRTDEDYEDAIKELKTKGKSLFVRANKLYKNFYNTKKDIQLNFFEE